jgi:hypothetical protein
MELILGMWWGGRFFRGVHLVAVEGVVQGYGRTETHQHVIARHEAIANCTEESCLKSQMYHVFLYITPLLRFEITLVTVAFKGQPCF